MGSGAKVAILVAVIGLGVLATHALVIAPRRQEKKIRAEVEAWSESWGELRACIMPDPKLSPDPLEAMTLRDILDPRATESLESCRSRIADLKRPPGDATENEAVEDAWLGIEKPVAALAGALAWRTSDDPGQSLDALAGKLVDAVAAVDAAHAALRKAAGLSAPEPPATGAPRIPAAPDGFIVTVGGADPITVRGGDGIMPATITIEGGAIVIEGSSGGGREVAVVRGPNAVEVRSIGDIALAAAASTPWGLVFEPRGQEILLKAVPLDAAGDAAGAGTVVASAEAGDGTYQPLEPVAAVGGGRDRVVLYWHAAEEADELWLARSRDGGATWKDRRRVGTIDADPEITVSWALRRADVVWPDGEAVSWLSLGEDDLGGALAPVRLSSEADLPSPCYAEGAIWWVRPGQSVVRAGLGAGGRLDAIEYPPAAGAVACDGDALVLAQRVAPEAPLWRCAVGRGCERHGVLPYTYSSELEVTGSGRVATVLTGGLLFVATDGGGGPQPAFRLGPDVGLAELVEWNGVPHAVLRDDRRVRVIPLARP